MLYTDSAVAGEAAGIGMGLLLAGSASDKAQELLAYAHDTQHEKIIRGEGGRGGRKWEEGDGQGVGEGGLISW